MGSTDVRSLGSSRVSPTDKYCFEDCTDPVEYRNPMFRLDHFNCSLPLDGGTFAKIAGYRLPSPTLEIQLSFSCLDSTGDEDGAVTTPCLQTWSIAHRLQRVPAVISRVFSRGGSVGSSRRKKLRFARTLWHFVESPSDMFCLHSHRQPFSLPAMIAIRQLEDEELLRPVRWLRPGATIIVTHGHRRPSHQHLRPAGNLRKTYCTPSHDPTALLRVVSFVNFSATTEVASESDQASKHRHNVRTGSGILHLWGTQDVWQDPEMRPGKEGPGKLRQPEGEDTGFLCKALPRLFCTARASQHQLDVVFPCDTRICCHDPVRIADRSAGWVANAGFLPGFEHLKLMAEFLSCDSVRSQTRTSGRHCRGRECMPRVLFVMNRTRGTILVGGSGRSGVPKTPARQGAFTHLTA
nr:hypothetical protein CFP56_21979 [Quercus suber]